MVIQRVVLIALHYKLRLLTAINIKKLASFWVINCLLCTIFTQALLLVSTTNAVLHSITDK